MKKKSIILFFFITYLASSFGQDNLNTTRIGVWPYGFGNTVAMHEDHIFLSHGRTIQVFEYTNPVQPQLLGEVFMDDMIRVFAFENDKAFVAGYDKFYILDISNTTQPGIISSFNLQSSANAICLSNGYVYLALQSTGILILNVSDLYNPEMAAFYQTDKVNYDMAISNDIAWVASGYEGLIAYDLSDPVSPVPLLTYNESGSMQSIQISDNLLYAANSSSGIMVFDISNLPQLQLLSSTPTPSGGVDLNIEGNLLSVTLLHDGFCLYDISDPASPDSLDQFFAEKFNRKTLIKDGLAFHCNSSDFSILDISNPHEMNLIANIGLSGVTQYVHYWDSILFINTIGGPIMAVDVTDPQQAVKIAQIESGEGHYTIHVKDDLLFSNNYYWLKVYDVSTPSEPVYLNTIEASTTITCVLKQNDVLFVNDYDNLQVFDISDIYSPTLLGVYPYGRVEQMIAAGNYLYCADGSEIKIVDFSDPSNLNLLPSIGGMSITSMAIKDTLLYVVSSIPPQVSEASLKVFNIKDPGSVKRVASLNSGRYFEAVTIDGDYLYVFEKDVGLHIYDTKEIYPVVCGFYNSDNLCFKMATENGFTYLPAFAGIDIIQNDLINSTENIFIERSERLNLFPNPADDVINFVLENDNHSGIFTWEIMQMNGTGAKSGKLAAGQQQISLDKLPAGVYVLKIMKAGEKHKSGLFIKQ